MIIMSVDLGKARTGIAVSDPGESFAFPKTVITEYNETRLAEKVGALAKEYGAELIVVGYPKIWTALPAAEPPNVPRPPGLLKTAAE